VAHWWLTGRGKSATLSSIVVGTIDQVLVAGLVAKHAVLRHLGLAGKVVILDEIHAADAYMTQYLTRVLTWLGAYRVPVIALSATLPPVRRRALLSAYNLGRDRTTLSQQSDAYPLLTQTAPSGSLSVEVLASSRRSDVVVDELPGDPIGIADAVAAACVNGGHVAIVCNTVSRAQAVFRRLRTTVGNDYELVLLHSRFLTPERLASESLLRDELGPVPSSPRLATRRLIVVATQVVEQSLDLDFDLMFSDIAPIDLLIQRAGRLHRHERPPEARPSSMREPRLVITGFSRTERRAPELDKGAQAVYGAAALLRALAVLDEHRAEVGPLRSPDDVALLVARGYAEDLAAPTGWKEAWNAAETRKLATDTDKAKRANAFRLPPPGRSSLQGWDSAPAADTHDAKGLAQVRDADDAIEVVVVQRLSGQLCAPAWVDKIGCRSVELGPVIEDDLARILARNTVRLPAYLARVKTGDDIIDELEGTRIDCWQNSRWLRGMLPLVLGEDRRATVANHSIYYDTELGLVVDFPEER
jgi:CRISPR-associated endonuclease/helicase Cas3